MLFLLDLEGSGLQFRKITTEKLCSIIDNFSKRCTPPLYAPPRPFSVILGIVSQEQLIPSKSVDVFFYITTGSLDSPSVKKAVLALFGNF